MRETRLQSLGREDPLEKEMAIHSSTLAWKIPWMEEPHRLQPKGSQSQTWLSDFTFTFTFGRIVEGKWGEKMFGARQVDRRDWEESINRWVSENLKEIGEGNGHEGLGDSEAADGIWWLGDEELTPQGILFYCYESDCCMDLLRLGPNHSLT